MKSGDGQYIYQGGICGGASLTVCHGNTFSDAVNMPMCGWLNHATALPCRICVYGQKGNITVATLKPRQLIGLYEDSQALQAVAGEVEDALVAIIDTACAQAES